MAELREVPQEDRDGRHRTLIFYFPGNNNYKVVVREMEWGIDVVLYDGAHLLGDELDGLIAALQRAQEIAAAWAAEGSASEGLDVLIDEPLTYPPLVWRPITINLEFKGDGEDTEGSESDDR